MDHLHYVMKKQISENAGKLLSMETYSCKGEGINEVRSWFFYLANLTKETTKLKEKNYKHLK